MQLADSAGYKEWQRQHKMGSPHLHTPAPQLCAAGGTGGVDHLLQPAGTAPPRGAAGSPGEGLAAGSSSLEPARQAAAFLAAVDAVLLSLRCLRAP